MALCTQADVEATLQIDIVAEPDPTITGYIAAADAYIKRWLGRTIEQFTEADQPYRPVGSFVAAPDYPITQLTVVEDGTTLTVNDDYVVEPGGIIRRLNGWGRYANWDPRVGRVVLSGEYGYATVPDDLVRACALMVAAMFEKGVVFNASPAGSGPVRSEQVGDHSVAWDTSSTVSTMGQSFVGSGARELAASYRRTILVDPVTAPAAYTP